jgi:hypothetical protein
MLVFTKYFYKNKKEVVLWRPCRCPKVPNQREYMRMAGGPNSGGAYGELILTNTPSVQV